MTAAPAPAAPSAGARRMRLYRDRRKKKLRCVMIGLFESEVDGLIRSGYLRAGQRSDKYAVRKAVHSFLDRIFLRR
jgi:hypothetical protein